MTRRKWIVEATATSLAALNSGALGVANSCCPRSVKSSPWPGFSARAAVFTPPACAPDKVIRRKLITELKDLSEVTAAYRIWRDLKSDDPRGPNISMQVHAWYCGSHSPFGDIHHNWEFLPWHRAFIYFHERTLAKLVHNPDFRLPVWDWENNSSLWSFLFAPNKPPAYQHVPAQFVTCDELRKWLESSRFECFCGWAKAEGAASGTVHVYIHHSVNPAFASSDTAARESIFFPHHANVDRYWAHWWNSYVTHGPKWACPPGFASTSYQLYDECGNEVTVNAQDFLDPCRLGYSYTPPHLPLAVLTPFPERIPISVNDRSKPFKKLPKSIDSLDPVPVDATLNLRNVAVDLSRLNTIALRAGRTTIDAGRIATLGHDHHPSSITWRISFQSADLAALRDANIVEIGLIPLNYALVKRVPEIFMPVDASLQFYERG